MSFNQAQIQAIAHKEGPCMVLAGPGSGKTTVITNRIKYMIQEHKVSPEEILVITFSKAAATEMRERFFALEDMAQLPVTFGTFHGIYYGILKWAYRLDSRNILSEEEKYKMLVQAMEQLQIETDGDKEVLQLIAEEISVVKNNLLCPNSYCPKCCEEDKFRKIYRKYEELCRNRRKVDFDDMLVMTYQLFQKRMDLLKKWQKKFRYILIDEFQDINQVQYEVIRMLANPENNLFVVGDDDQSIYQFRGARPEIMLGFREDYPDSKQIVLDMNYRSTKTILGFAQDLVSHNQMRYSKMLRTDNEVGTDIQVQKLSDGIAESKYVLHAIQKKIEDGVLPSQIAVLYRTNMKARVFVETCMEYNIPFQSKESIPNLYEHFICQDFITYVKMALGDRNRKSFLQVMNRPNRYISRASVETNEISFEHLRSFYQEKEWMLDRIDDFEEGLRMMRNMAPYGAIQFIRKHFGYDEFLREYAYKRNIKPEGLKEILSEMEERAKEYKSIEEWLLHIEHFGREAKQQAKDGDGIILMSMHASKGLEFDTVFIIGANEKITPHKKAQMPEEIEEERRMFYVAMTRAKRNLTITYTEAYNGKPVQKSRFLEEACLE